MRVGRVNRQIRPVDPVAENTVPQVDRLVVTSHLPLVRGWAGKRQRPIAPVEHLNIEHILGAGVRDISTGRRVAHLEDDRIAIDMWEHDIHLQPAVLGRWKRQVVVDRAGVSIGGRLPDDRQPHGRKTKEHHDAPEHDC